MSIPVPVDRLAQTRADFGLAVLICPRAQTWPQVLVVDPAQDGLDLLMPVPRTIREATPGEPLPVTLVWTATGEGEHSLVVDGWASAEGDRLRVRVEHAVLHRPRLV